MTIHLRHPARPAETAVAVEHIVPSGVMPEQDICRPFELQVSLLAPVCGYLKPPRRWHFWEHGLSESRLVPVQIELERTCSGCGGSGYVPVAVSDVCSRCTGSRVELSEAGEEACGVCDGDGWVQRERTEQCECCDGTGLELTRAGRRLLRAYGLQLQAFLDRWHSWTRIGAAILPGGRP